MLFPIEFVAHRSQICTVAIHLVVDLETIFSTWFLGMCMIYSHAKFHILRPSVSLGIAVIPKATYRFRAAAILFTIPALKSTSNFAYSSKALLLCRISGPCMKWRWCHCHITSSSFRRNDINGCRKLKRTSMWRPPVAQYPYQFSSESIQRLSSWHTDRHGQCHVFSFRARRPKNV